MEGLLDEAPRHRGLLLACTSGFVQYAYGWVQMEADVVEAKDLARATELRARAQKLYLRARDYGLRGLELDAPGLRDELRRDPKAALARTKPKHVPLLYWTAMAWAGALSLKVNDSELSADQPLVEALARARSSSSHAGASARSTSSSSAGSPRAPRSAARSTRRASTTRPTSPARRGGAPSRTWCSPRA